MSNATTTSKQDPYRSDPRKQPKLATAGASNRRDPIRFLGLVSVLATFALWFLASQDGLGWFPRIQFPRPAKC